MLHGERYVYCNERDENNNKVQVTTYIKASYRVEKAPCYKEVEYLGYYRLYVRQVKDRVGGKFEKISERRIEVRVPASALEALLKDAKLSYTDDELL